MDKASSGEKEIINFVLGTFAFNIRSGLILVDEPELHLHPRWQHLLRDLFRELANDTKNQFVLASHSPAFITPTTIGNVRRIFKSQLGETRICIPATTPVAKDALHIVNTHNNERIFFADRVVLVEGPTDRIFFGKLIAEFLDVLQRTEVVEVVEVFGRANFGKYTDFLSGLDVEWCLIADRDYLVIVGDEKVKGLFETDFAKIHDDVIKNKKSEDGKALAIALDRAISSQDLTELGNLFEYIKSRLVRLKSNLTASESELLRDFIAQRRAERCFILPSGEVEDYLPEGFRSLDRIAEAVKVDSFRGWLRERLPKDKMDELETVLLEIIRASEDDKKLITQELPA